MARDSFAVKVAGRWSLRRSSSTSAGDENAGDLVALGDNGYLHPSLFNGLLSQPAGGAGVPTRVLDGQTFTVTDNTQVLHVDGRPIVLGEGSVVVMGENSLMATV